MLHAGNIGSIISTRVNSLETRCAWTRRTGISMERAGNNLPICTWQPFGQGLQTPPTPFWGLINTHIFSDTSLIG